MNSSYYNNKLTFITEEECLYTLPEYFVPFYGNKTIVCNKIKQYEYDNDTVFNGHLFVNDFENFEYLKTKCDFRSISKEYRDPKLAYFYNIWNSPNHRECGVDESVVLLSTFALPFYCYTEHTQCTTYTNLARHRIGLTNFKFTSI